MNLEGQNIEYKRIWKDEYLKWVSGFANAQGGKIYIGIDDDMSVMESRTCISRWRISPIKS